MCIRTKIKGVAKLGLLLAAGLAVSCGQQQFQGNPNVTDQPVVGTGTLKLASDSFPEGAVKLVLNIKRIGRELWPCYSTTSSSQVTVGGMALKALPPAPPYPIDCVLPTPVGGDLGEARIITVKKGEEIAPVRLRAGSYSVLADFFDASEQVLYTGLEDFSISDGEQTSIIIRLRKVESGQVTIGFEVEKPLVLPTHISDDAFLGLRRSNGYSKGVGIAQNIDLNLLTGAAAVSTSCVGGVNCMMEFISKNVILKGAKLEKVRAITRTVSLKKVDHLCSDPLVQISLILKKCKECEEGKTYDFSNSGCGRLVHSLTEEQFSQIWDVVKSAVEIR